MQFNEFKKACRLLNMLIEENDERADIWYMLAFSLLKIEKYDSSNECLKNAVTICKKFKVHDEELEAGIQEIRAKLDEAMANVKPDEDKDMKDDDDGFETYGEEDDDSDEEQEKKASSKK